MTKPPTVTAAYAMIRVLRKRAQKGDGERIAQLEKLIADEKEKAALLDIDKFFGSAPDPQLHADARDLGAQLASQRAKK